MKRLLIIVFISTLFVGCSDKTEDHKRSNTPIIGDEKQTGKW